MIILIFFSSEKADLKSRSDSTSGGPQGDSIYTTPAGFHHQQQQQQQQTQAQQQQLHPHHQQLAAAAAAAAAVNAGNNHGHHGSPEAMKVRMAAMILQPPTRV